jgi:hypothetical protein
MGAGRDIAGSGRAQWGAVRSVAEEGLGRPGRRQAAPNRGGVSGRGQGEGVSPPSREGREGSAVGLWLDRSRGGSQGSGRSAAPPHEVTESMYLPNSFLRW